MKGAPAMTISSQTLNATERNKFNSMRQGKSQSELKAIDKKLANIIKTAIQGAGAAEAANIKNRIALAVKRAFRI
jgi:hypothetical protein